MTVKINLELRKLKFSGIDCLRGTFCRLHGRSGLQFIAFSMWNSGYLNLGLVWCTFFVMCGFVNLICPNIVRRVLGLYAMWFVYDWRWMKVT